MNTVSGDSVTVTAGGIRLHLLEHGPGWAPELVIVPGITSPAATWEFVAERLAGRWRVLTLDVRGRGLSDKPGSGFTLRDYAADLAGVVEALKLERPAVLGHSMGARIAAAFGVLHPDLRGPLLLVDPPLTGPGREPYATPLSAFVESLRTARAGATADDMRPYFPTWSDEHLALRARWLATCDETAVAESHRLMHEEDFFALWRRLEPPVGLLYGSESPAVTADGARELAEANPHAEMAAVEGAGHMVPWDELEGFLEAAGGFLERVTSSTTWRRAQ